LVYEWLKGEKRWLEELMGGFPKITANMVVEVLFAAWNERSEEEKASFANGFVGRDMLTKVRIGRPRGKWAGPRENYDPLRELRKPDQKPDQP
jgi:hypothetical protein